MRMQMMKRRIWIKLFLFAVLVGVVVFAHLYFRPLLDALPLFIQSQKHIALPFFGLIYIIGTVCFLPGAALTLAGGFLFGPWLGGFISLVAATIGSSLSFLLARYFLSDWVARHAKGILGQLIQGINSEGWRFVAFVRLVPLFPFNLVNYAFGLTQVGFWVFTWASFFCMAPGAFAYSYLGSLGQDALQGHTAEIVKKSFIVVALFSIIIFIPYFIRKIRANKKH